MLVNKQCVDQPIKKSEDWLSLLSLKTSLESYTNARGGGFCAVIALLQCVGQKYKE